LKKIVIVGGGVSGKKLSEALSKNENIETILVEPKDYIEVPFGQLRALVDPNDFSPKIRRKYSQILPNVKHIMQKAIGIKEKKLILEDGSDVDFDYLVIATGSKFPNWKYLNSFEANMEARQKEVINESKKLEDSSSILIIGGGPVGVELAGEIAYRWTDKKITIVNGGSRILGSLSEKMTQRAGKILKSMGVIIINETRLSSNENGKLSDTKGNIYEADIVYMAVGISIQTDWIGEDSKISKNENGAIKVDSNLRVIGRDDIFAMGDITDVPEIKLGAFASIHSTVTAQNINILIKNPNAKLKTYKPGKTMSMVPIGKKLGAVQMSFVFPHFLIGIKQKDLFTSTVFKK
jgi:NADH dehydrogenase FAD-containing subunit